MRKQWVLVTCLLRQNRWRTFLLLLWPAVIGAFAAHGASPADVAAAVQQAIFYAQSFLILIAGVMLGQEIRSRRILLPLACNVSRAQYLTAVALALLLLVAAESVQLLVFAGYYLGRIPLALGLAIVLLQVTVAAMGVFWSTILRDIFATLATIVSAGVLLALGIFAPFAWPVLPAIRAVVVVNGLHATGSGFQTSGMAWWAAALAAVECVILWLAALEIFRRKDIAVPSAD